MSALKGQPDGGDMSDTPRRSIRVLEGTTRVTRIPGHSRSARLGALEWISFPLCWALVGFGTTLVFQTSRTVLGIGGVCAEGGPYVIAVPCPPQATLFMSLGILAVVGGSLASLFLQRGFGVPAWGYGWAALFAFGAAAFFEAAFRDDVWSWHLCGWIFAALALGVVPLLIIFWPSSVLGSRALDGTELAEGHFGLVDALVVVGLAVASAVAGVYVAGLLLAGAN